MYPYGAFKPSRPVAVLDIHSVDDPRAIYIGGQGPPYPGTNVRSSHRAVMDGVNNWVRNNGCMTTPRVADTKKAKDQTATLMVWDGCKSGAEVAHWKLTGVGHAWPGNLKAEMREEIIGPPTTLISAAEEAWSFVSRARR